MARARAIDAVAWHAANGTVTQPKLGESALDLRKVDRLAETMVSYSLQVNRDEVVLICGEVSSAVLLDRLYQAVLSAGARPVLRLKGDLSLETHLELGGHQTLNPTSVSDGTPIDCSIGIWTLYKSDRKRQPVEQAVASRDLARQSEFLCRAAEGKIRWVVALWPTDDAADMAGMNRYDFEELVWSASMLDQDRPADAWSEMREKQQALCDRLTNARKLQIRSVSGTDLTLGIGGRTWISGCGRSNLPDGEVFSGPIHEEVEGTWCSSFPAFFEGQRIAGARFEIKRGRVVRANADSGQDALTSLLERDQGSAIVGEIGFGTNQRLKRGTGVGLLDEKIAGTAHIGIGASYPATGSTNRSSVHRDFVCDLRSGGTILVDGEPLFLEATVT